MKASTVLGGLATAAVLLVVALDLSRGKASPGSLSAVHGQVLQLSDPLACDLCHGGGDQDLADACLACHAGVGASLTGGIGFHADLGGADARDCGACHREHGGHGLALVDERTFGLAGFDGRAGYDHRGLGFVPAGLHGDLDCSACHPRADAQVLAPGESRFGGLAPDCSACHDDPHGSVLTQSCGQCHGQSEPFGDLAGFRHRDDVPLVGGHGGLACDACHPGGGALALDGLLDRGPAAARDCVDCHGTPHRAGFVAASAEVGGDCAACHAAEHGSFTSPDLAAATRFHGASGFPLDGPHRALDCAACHRGTTFEARFPGRSPNDCAACHGDPHGGQFAGPAGVLPDCRTCHDAQAFVPSTFGPADHGRTFPLTGSHAGLDCAACHGGGGEGPRAFRGLASDCASCHDDPHRAAPWAGVVTDCATCHTTDEFRHAARTFDHGRWTGFALEGAHGRADCAACHRPAVGEARTLGPPRGTSCADCHDDPHHRAPWAGAAPDCAVCHTPDDFRRAGQTFDHGSWTGFALEGAHGRADCVACHRASPGDTARLGPAPPGSVDSCATCHADPHRENFDDVPGGCAGCHGTEAFAPARGDFDHGWTGFPLARGHGALACAECHASLAAPDALGRRFAPAAGQDCADCHGDPHAGQFAVGGRSDCARCHATDLGLIFDHGATRFPLDERHRSLDCAACHRPWPLADGRRVRRYRPLGTACADCHGAPSGGER